MANPTTTPAPIQSFYPGYRLQDTDLNVTFFAQGISYPPALTYPYSPYSLSYEIGFLNDDGRVLRVGPLDRIPYNISTGVYRADFVVGDDWATGTYQLTWKYKISANSDTQETIQQFEILNYVDNVLFQIFYCRRDLPATLVVLIDSQDLPASFAITP
jgi:hypothetical protein